MGGTPGSPRSPAAGEHIRRGPSPWPEVAARSCLGGAGAGAPVLVLPGTGAWPGRGSGLWLWPQAARVRLARLARCPSVRVNTWLAEAPRPHGRDPALGPLTEPKSSSLLRGQGARLQGPWPSPTARVYGTNPPRHTQPRDGPAKTGTPCPRMLRAPQATARDNPTSKAPSALPRPAWAVGTGGSRLAYSCALSKHQSSSLQGSQQGARDRHCRRPTPRTHEQIQQDNTMTPEGRPLPP